MLAGASGPPGKGVPAPPFGLPGFSRSPDQKILEKMARVFLHPSEGVTVRELLQLSPDHLSAVSRLMDTLALGPDAVEWWLNDYAPKGRIRLDRSGPGPP